MKLSKSVHFLLTTYNEVIYPKDTRRKLVKAFQMLEGKEVNLPKRKHGNIPL